MSEIKRREFLEQLGRAGVLSGAAALGLGGFELAALAAKKPRVVVVRGSDPVRMLKSAMRVFRSLEQQIKGKTVVLKPNMSFKNPAAWGNNTSPEVAAAVAQMCVDWGAAKITAVDHTLSRGSRSVKASGVGPALSKIKGVEVLAADKKSLYLPKTVKQGKQLKRTDIPRVVAAADVLINIPVAKQHEATKVSFGLKNLMGLIWDRRHFHQMISLHQGIADLATLLRPQLTVIDATRSLVTNGPQGPGQVQKLHALVVSTDPVAADAVALGLTQWKRQRLAPKDVEHIAAAAKLGVGIADLSKIKIIKKRV